MPKAKKQDEIVFVGSIVLPNGTAIGDASTEDLLEAAEFYHEQAEKMIQKAKFLEQTAKIKPMKKKTQRRNDRAA